MSVYVADLRVVSESLDANAVAATPHTRKIMMENTCVFARVATVNHAQ